MGPSKNAETLKQNLDSGKKGPPAVRSVEGRPNKEPNRAEQEPIQSRTDPIKNRPDQEPNRPRSDPIENRSGQAPTRSTNNASQVGSLPNPLFLQINSFSNRCWLPMANGCVLEKSACQPNGEKQSPMRSCTDTLFEESGLFKTDVGFP